MGRERDEGEGEREIWGEREMREKGRERYGKRGRDLTLLYEVVVICCHKMTSIKKIN